MNKRHFFWLVGAVLLGASSLGQSATVTDGFTFAVASGSVGGVGVATTGTHYHSNTGGDFGNPAGLAEVGEFGGTSGEEVRGLSEYSLSGLTEGPAFVTFDVYQAGGLFAGDNDYPFDGTINLVAYQGNNAEDISDFEATAVDVGSFSTSAIAVGDTLSFEITDIFADALTDSWISLGIRLEVSTQGNDPEGGAWVFNDFRLTSTDESTGPASAIPTTGVWGLSILVVLLGLLGAWRQRERVYR